MELKKIELIGKQIKLRQARERDLEERNRVSDIIREQQKKQDQELDNRLRQQVRLRITTRKDREGLIVIKDKENKYYQN